MVGHYNFYYAHELFAKLNKYKNNPRVAETLKFFPSMTPQKNRATNLSHKGQRIAYLWTMLLHHMGKGAANLVHYKPSLPKAL